MPKPRRSFVQRFLAWEAASGIVLLAAAVVALLVANSALAPAYFAALHAKIGPLTVHYWVNDVLMAVFFFVVGLEIKRECLDGHLTRADQRVLPAIAAAGGMIVPALVFLGVARDPMLLRGWAIPAATDIAFALGILALLGTRAPPALKLFLTSVAIIDDMGAVTIIALFYTAKLALPALALAALVLAGLFVANRRGVRAIPFYVVGAVVLWLAVFASGVHATVAGVLAAFTVPLGRGERDSPLYRLEHALHPWSAFAIVPLFGFANAGVSLSGVTPATLLAPLPLAVALGLFLGKQVGIYGTVRAAAALRIVTLPPELTGLRLYGVALLCGVGFTMSLFIGGLAFADPRLLDEVKIGVLTGSFLSGLAGYLVLRFSARPGPSPSL